MIAGYGPIGWQVDNSGGGSSPTSMSVGGAVLSPGDVYDPSFVVMASCIPAVLNAFVNGTPIQWGILDQTTGHTSSFFNSAIPQASGVLRIGYPTVKRVLYGASAIDEHFSNRGTATAGPSVGFSFMDISAAVAQTAGLRLDGNGTAIWTESGGQFVASIQISNITAGGETGIFFDTTAINGFDLNLVVVTYMGTNNYRIRRGTLAGWHLSFFLIDIATNLPVLAAPTANDIVLISGGGSTGPEVIPLNTFVAGKNDYFDTSTNFWVWGLFECWVVATPVTSASILVRWQNPPTSTLYKISRSDTGVAGPYTLIHTGTDFSFLDTNVLPNILYNYKFTAVIGGVDTDMSTFQTTPLQQ